MSDAQVLIARVGMCMYQVDSKVDLCKRPHSHVLFYFGRSAVRDKRFLGELDTLESIYEEKSCCSQVSLLLMKVIVTCSGHSIFS
jgi:hypothetical protein